MKGRTNQEKGTLQNHSTARVIVSTRSVTITEGSQMTASAVNIGDVPITVVIRDTENVHTARTVITHPTLIKGTDIAIVVIGDPGTTGMTMPDISPGCTNMVDTTEREGI